MLVISPLLFAVLSGAAFLVSFLLLIRLTGLPLRALLGDFFYLFRLSRKRNSLLFLSGIGLFIALFLYLLGEMLSPLGRAVVLHLELLGIIYFAVKNILKERKNE